VPTIEIGTASMTIAVACQERRNKSNTPAANTMPSQMFSRTRSSAERT
jgi:hypothetical protein